MRGDEMRENILTFETQNGKTLYIDELENGRFGIFINDSKRHEFLKLSQAIAYYKQNYK